MPSSPQIAAAKISPGSRLSLRDPRDDNLLAILTVSDIYTPNKRNEALKVFGSEDDKLHPAIEYLHDQAKERYVGGKVQAISLPGKK